MLKPYPRKDLKPSSEIDLGFAPDLPASSTTTRPTGGRLVGLASTVKVSITSAGTPCASKASVNLEWRQSLEVEILTMMIG